MSLAGRALNAVERIGNRLPDPVFLFLWLIGGLVVSQGLTLLSTPAIYLLFARAGARRRERREQRRMRRLAGARR